MDGIKEVVLTECNGEAFLFPNDLVFGRDGAIYLTDSGIIFKDLVPDGKIRPDYMDVHMELYKSRGKTNITINWSKTDKLFKDSRYKNKLKIMEFRADLNCYMMSLEEFVQHLNKSLNFTKSRYF